MARAVLGVHPPGPGVEALGPVQGDGGHPLGHLVADHLEVARGRAARLTVRPRSRPGPAGPARPARAGRSAGRAGRDRRCCSAAASRRGATRAARRPAATATGAHESHSYWPPGVGVDVGLAAHHGHGLGPGRSHLDQLAAELLGQPGGGRRGPAAADDDPRRARRRRRAAGSAGRCRGSAPGPAGPPRRPPARPPMTRATCTAQSVRGGSPNSRVPSRGSTIHTRSAPSRTGSSRPSSDSTASPAASRSARRSMISTWARRSPCVLEGGGVGPVGHQPRPQLHQQLAGLAGHRRRQPVVAPCSGRHDRRSRSGAAGIVLVRHGFSTF